MQKIGIEFPDGADEPAGQADIRRRNVAPHREPMDAEGEGGLDALEMGIGVGVIGGRGINDADTVPGSGLRVGEVRDVADKAVRRRADTVKDAKPRSRRRQGDWRARRAIFDVELGERHRQMSRSRTVMVSPGMSGSVRPRYAVSSRPP